MSKHIKNRLQRLGSINAGEKRKAEFRGALEAHMAAYPALEQRRGFGMAFFFMRKGAAALFVVAVALTTGAGATFASQNALPGDALYPFKLTTEKVRVALSASSAGKNQLHLQFASRRLYELEEIVQNESAQQSNVDALFVNYQTELEESQKLLGENPEKTEEIAVSIDQATASHRQTIKAISEKARKKTFSDTLKQRLYDADEHAQSKNEFANLALLTGTSTQDVPAASTEPATVRKEFKEKSRTKIKSVEQKIKDTEDALKQGKEKGADDQTRAEELLKEAKQALENAKNQSENGSYGDSFIASVKARKTAREAERIMEQGKKKSEHDENQDHRPEE